MAACRVLQSAQMEVFLLDQKEVYLSHFLNAKYVETRFVKIKEYTARMWRTA